MTYRKINVELIVFAEETDAVIANLNTALDHLEEHHTLFGGAIETAPVDHPGQRRTSALSHTVAAAGTVAGALKTAHRTVRSALRHAI